MKSLATLDRRLLMRLCPAGKFLDSGGPPTEQHYDYLIRRYRFTPHFHLLTIGGCKQIQRDRTDEWQCTAVEQLSSSLPS
jgi:hypothetical protein